MTSTTTNSSVKPRAQNVQTRTPAAVAKPTTATFPFSDVSSPSEGVILRSSDRVDFRVYKNILALASPVFRDMFSLPQQQTQAETPSIRNGVASNGEQMIDGLPVIQLTENSETLNALLRTIYPVAPPPLKGMSLDGKVTDVEKLVAYVSPLLDAAVKYDINVFIKELCTKLIDAANHVRADGTVVDDTLAVRIYVLACRYKLKDVAHLAAFAALRGRVRGVFFDDLQRISAAHYFRLLEYHEKVVNAVIPMIKLSRLKSDYTESISCSGCSGSGSSAPAKPWADYENRAIAVLRASPRSLEIFTAEFMENHFTKFSCRNFKCHAAMGGDFCRTLSQYLRELIERAVEKIKPELTEI